MKRILPCLLIPLLLAACGEDAVDLIVPEVSITYPQNGQSVSGIISLSAEASGPVAIFRVSFAVDDEEIGSVDSEPFLYQWDSAAWADGGAHTLIAQAEDIDGNIGFSDFVVVTVQP